MGMVQNLARNDYLAEHLGSWAVHLGLWGTVLRLLIALILSAAVGWERTNKRHSAGLRTFITVTLACTAAGMVDFFVLEMYGNTAFFTSAAAIVSAVLLSIKSVIYNSRTQIKGLTTAATLWLMGILGVALGIGLYTPVLCIFAAMWFALTALPMLEEYLKDKSNHFEVHLELKSARRLPAFAATIRRLGMRIDDIEYNPAYEGSGLSVYSVSFTISSEELKKYKSHQEIIDALGTLDYIAFIEEMN